MRTAKRAPAVPPDVPGDSAWAQQLRLYLTVADDIGEELQASDFEPPDPNRPPEYLKLLRAFTTDLLGFEKTSVEYRAGCIGQDVLEAFQSRIPSLLPNRGGGRGRKSDLDLSDELTIERFRRDAEDIRPLARRLFRLYRHGDEDDKTTATLDLLPVVARYSKEPLSQPALRSRATAMLRTARRTRDIEERLLVLRYGRTFLNRAKRESRVDKN